MSLQRLHDILLSVSNEKKTGKIYIYVREGGSRKAGLILIDAGEILSISYSNKTGEDALRKFLSIAVEEVIFMPRSDVANGKREPDSPMITQVLLQLRDKSIAEGIGNNNKIHSAQGVSLPQGVSLRQEVQMVLQKIYGPGISKEIDKIANVCSPDKNPYGFLNECKLKAMLILSKDQVETLFKPLYMKIMEK